MVICDTKTIAARSSRCGNKKKNVVSKHPDKKALQQQRGAFKDIPRYLDYVSVADELAAGTFVETQESVSSGLHMSAFPPLLIKTSFPRGRREEESYFKQRGDMFFSVLSWL